MNKALTLFYAVFLFGCDADRVCSSEKSTPGYQCTAFKEGSLVQLNSGGAIMSVAFCDKPKALEHVTVTWHDSQGQPHDAYYYIYQLRAATEPIPVNNN